MAKVKGLPNVTRKTPFWPIFPLTTLLTELTLYHVERDGAQTIRGRRLIGQLLGVSQTTLKNWRIRYDTDRWIYKVGGRWSSTNRELEQMVNHIKKESGLWQS